MQKQEAASMLVSKKLRASIFSWYVSIPNRCVEVSFWVFSYNSLMAHLDGQWQSSKARGDAFARSALN